MAKSIVIEVVYYSDASLQPSFDKGFGHTIQWDIPLLEGYRYSFIKNFSPSKSMDCKWYNAINFSVFKKIKTSTAQILLINGWSYFTDCLVILSAKLYGKEVWVRADNPLSQEQRKGIKAVLKKFVLRKLLFPQIDKFLYVGKESKAFFEFYGAKQHQLIYTPHAVDNNYFQKLAKQFENKRSLFRNNLNIPIDSFVVLVTAKLIKEKNHFDVIYAFENLKRYNCFLILVGDGPQKNKIESYIQNKKINNILLTGFINQSEIYKYYLISNCFVLSSFSETWGLAVNEAMNFGLPILTSDACGCAKDLVEPHLNGDLFAVGDIKKLSSLIEKYINDENLCKRSGHRSLEKINDYSYATIISNLSNYLIK